MSEYDRQQRMMMAANASGGYNPNDIDAMEMSEHMMLGREGNYHH